MDSHPERNAKFTIIKFGPLPYCRTRLAHTECKGNCKQSFRKVRVNTEPLIFVHTSALQDVVLIFASIKVNNTANNNTTIILQILHLYSLYLISFAVFLVFGDLSDG